VSRQVIALERARGVRARTVLTVLAAFLCPPAHALITSCTVTASGVLFGIYTPLTNAISTGTVNLSCVVVLPETVPVALSTGASGSYAQRTMTSGANTLTYNLYTTAANNVVWGDGSGGSQVIMLSLGIGLPTMATATVYGLVPSQDPAPGSYNDVITVSVSY
jgi:spore coat protein U-like protein